MGGFFGVVSESNCVDDLFYGTDYHSHLGTKRGGLAVHSATGFTRFINDISNTQFRTKFEHFAEMGGGEVNPTELVATLINREATFEDGIRSALMAVEGSCSMLLLDALVNAIGLLPKEKLCTYCWDGAE